ncbi:MAG TPA: SDR family NAD(P)-dependent oxidoreductase, partial [Streptosporangiaceae bacterium]|nr:SDR family NAD(P)-dependent oxidoreductase [Streptosporangiaceae bacterium]
MPGDLAGRAFLVTGGSTGIGLATATSLAARGGRVCITSRSVARGQAAVAGIAAATGNAEVSFLQLDLADLASVRRSAQEFLDRGGPLHVLINNAGLAGRRGLTADGFELAFGVNHLGTFAFTTALLDRLAGSGPARVVTVSSDAHYAAKGIDFTTVRRRTRSITGLPEYQVSKLGNVLFSQELARRLAGTGVTSYALHPGVVASDIWRRVPWPARP